MPVEIGTDAAIGHMSSNGGFYVAVDSNQNARTMARVEVVSRVVDGTVAVHLPGLGMTKQTHAFDSAPLAPGRSRFTLRSSAVYDDSRTIELSLQVFDKEQFSFKTETALVLLEVTPLSSNDSRRLLPYTTTHTCKSTATGVCHISFTLPLTFLANVQDGEVLGVSYALGGQPAVMAGPLPRWSNPVLAADTLGTVYTRVPSRPVFGGEQFTIEVRSLFPRYLKTAEVRVVAGDGLTFVGDTAAKSNTGVDVFFGTMDRDGKVVSASLARKEGTPVATPANIATDELLFSLTVKVQNNVKSGLFATIVLDGIRFKDGNEALMVPTVRGVVMDRQGQLSDGTAAVHFEEDSIVGIMPYVEGATELLNTAILSGDAVLSNIVVKGIKRRGGEIDVTSNCICTSQDPRVVQVKEGTCTALLDGTEDRGAREAVIDVKCGSLSSTVSLRVHAPVSVQAASSPSTLRAVAGWYANDDPDCKLFQYQPARLVATATFSDGSGVDIVGFDVSSLVSFSSSIDSVAVVTKRVYESHDTVFLNGKQPGSTVVHAINSKGGILSSVSVTVADQTAPSLLAVVGLDVHLLDDLGPITYIGDIAANRATNVYVVIAAPTKTRLQYEGDTMSVAAWAVLDDHSRITLDPANGLRIESLNQNAVQVSIVSNAVQLEVPSNPEANDGELLRVIWQPYGGCLDRIRNASNTGVAAAAAAGDTSFVHSTLGDYAAVTVDLEVRPPTADLLEAVVSTPLLVGPNDLATATGADFVSVGHISVALHFTDRIQSNLQHDFRCEFQASDNAPFTVDTNGTIFANSEGAVGMGTVIVRFAGQNVTDTVTVEVTRFATIVLFAAPEPSYHSSDRSVRVNQLSTIQCSSPTKYQQAKLHVVMHLHNGLERVLNDAFTTFRIASSTSAKHWLSEESRILTATQDGSAEIFVSFGGYEDPTPWAVVATSSAPVTVSSLQSLELHAQNGKKITTLSGAAGVPSAQLTLGLIWSDNRQYQSLFTWNQPTELPGMIQFSSLLSEKLRVTNTGAVTLLANHYEPVVLVATGSCKESADAKAFVSIACNLKPTSTGDVDLGYLNGAPIPPKSVGAKFTVPIRVNTGNKKLAAFNIRIQFDPDMLEPVLSDVKHTVPANKGAVDLKSSISEAGDEIVLAAVIQKSNIRGTTNGVSIAEVTFVAKSAGETGLTGIAVQLLDDTPGDPQQIGTAGTPFIAGAITLSIAAGSGNRPYQPSRRSRRSSTLSVTRVEQTQKRSLAILHRSRAQHRTRRAALARADANCDGKLSLEDPIRINDYIASRNGGFETALGRKIKTKTEMCQRQLELAASDTIFLDPDANQVVEGIDATYLLDIMVQNFYFFDIITTIATGPRCNFHVAVQLTNELGFAPRAGTRLLIDIGHGAANSAMSTQLAASNQFLTANKGTDNHLFGGLIEATPSSSTPGLFEVSIDIHGVDAGVVGVSIVQVATEDMAISPRWKFFAGPEADPIFAGSLTYAASTLNIDSDISRVSGYNPLIAGVQLSEPECRVNTPQVVSTETSTAVSSTSSQTSTSNTQSSTTVTGTTTTVSSTTGTSTTSSRTSTSNTQSSTTVTGTTTSVSSTTATSTTSSQTSTSNTQSSTTVTGTTTTVSSTTVTSTTSSQTSTSNTQSSTTVTGTTTSVSSTTVTSMTSSQTSTSNTQSSTTVTGTTTTVSSTTVTSTTSSHTSTSNTQSSTTVTGTTTSVSSTTVTSTTSSRTSTSNTQSSTTVTGTTTSVSSTTVTSTTSSRTTRTDTSTTVSSTTDTETSTTVSTTTTVLKSTAYPVTSYPSTSLPSTSYPATTIYPSTSISSSSSTSSSTAQPTTQDAESSNTESTSDGDGGVNLNCVDEDFSCPNWAKANYCEHSLYKNYLKGACKYSCGHCVSSTSAAMSTTLSSSTSTIAPTTQSSSSAWQSTSTNVPDSFSKCTDQHTSCVPWSSAGYCHNALYKAYLLSVCPFSCGAC